ncbi:hypothetical protein NMG60_11016371 [Bertholletia excelsa]
MSFSLARALIFLVAASMLVAANRAETVVVGGTKHWRYGFNYTGWSLKHGPFFLNDVLVFKYNLPSKTSLPHNVYLLPNLWSYIRCDFKGAKLLASTRQGVGEGFKYKLKEVRPLYFASGGGKGASDCKKGLMKFFVVPLPRWNV